MKFCVLFVFAPVLLFVVAWGGYRVIPESSPVARGAAYAETRDCVACHGDPEKPLLDVNDRDCSNANAMTGHPDYDVDCADVIAYFETVRLQRNFADRAQGDPGNPLIAGEQLAREYHCFRCHGHLGQGGFRNADSFKGYVPGYFGRDFELLTRNANPDAVREWISHGMNAAILNEPATGWIAEFYLNRQAVSMPSYKSLEPEDIEILVNYVIALHQFGPMTARIVRLYGERSRDAGSLAGLDDSLRSEALAEKR